MQKKKTPKAGGFPHTKLAGRVKTKKKVFSCGVQHTSKFRLEIEAAGLGLTDASATTQRQALLLILIYRGSKGINTIEGNACGFLRIATRIQELEDEGYTIASIKETARTSDGLIHRGIARYILMNQSAKEDPQGELDLGGDL